VEHAHAPRRGARDASGVEHVAPARARERNDLVPLELERSHQVRAEKTRGAGDQELHDG
jgi:hypothetical protein